MLPIKYNSRFLPFAKSACCLGILPGIRSGILIIQFYVRIELSTYAASVAVLFPRQILLCIIHNSGIVIFCRSVDHFLLFLRQAAKHEVKQLSNHILWFSLLHIASYREYFSFILQYANLLVK
jgi:hypothetical protein